MQTIIQKFNQDDNKFQQEAIIEARQYKGKINDIFLEHLEEFANNILKYKKEKYPFSIIYTIFLLAEFEERKLFPILIKIFNHEKYDFYEFMYDGIMDNLSSILVTVFNGDFNSLNSIIENKKIDEFVRESFLECYAYFYDNNIITKEELEIYLKKLIKMYKYKNDSIYVKIAEIIMDKHLFSMIEDVKEIFGHGAIDTFMFGDYPEFIDYIFNYEHLFIDIKKIEDTIKEMSWWYCFNANDSKDDDINDDLSIMDEFIKNSNKQLTIISTTQKVGRNDPCPCGSGKKYKKCCIDKEIKNTLPYNAYIVESLNDYPKRKENAMELDLYDFYKEEYIEIDELLYKVLKHKRIPMFIERDYKKENEINLKYLEAAYSKIKLVIENNDFKTIADYDDQVSIHYSLMRFLAKYSELLIDLNDFNKKDNLDKLEELLDYFYNKFQLNNQELLYLYARKKDLYSLGNRLEEGIEYFEKILETCDLKIKYDIYKYLCEICMKYDGDMEKVKKLIDKEKDKKLKDKLNEIKVKYEIY